MRFATLSFLVSVSACSSGHPPATHAEVAPATPAVGEGQQQPEAAPSFPHLLLRVTNFAADEGEDWSYVLEADGRFTGRGEMSNGGAEQTVWECSGQLTSTTLTSLFPRVARAANLTEAPPLPGAGAALDRGQPLGFTVGVTTDVATTRYAAPQPFEADLATVFGELNELGPTACRSWTERSP